MVRKDKTDYLIQSVSLACALLDQFRNVERDLSITELSRMLRVNKNYVFRLLATMERRGFVERNPQSGSYRLGITTLQMGESCSRSKHITREAHVTLDHMTRLCRETSMLHVLTDGDLVCVDVVDSTLPIRVQAKIGTSLPLQVTASGRVMLAFGNAEALSSCKGHGTAEKEKLSVSTLNELHRIREQGYAISHGEFNPDVCAAAAPVLDHRSRVAGVIAVVGPCCRISFERLDCEIAPLVVKSAQDLSAGMGFSEQKVAAPAVQLGVKEAMQQMAGLFPSAVPAGYSLGASRHDFARGICRSGQHAPEAFAAVA